jgi:hypothetical protein
VLVPYGAGAAKLAVDVRIPALEAFFAHIHTVLGAHVTGFSIRMIHALPHFNSFQIVAVV